MFQTVWLLLTYSYNIVLVFFIATHLFVGAIISFLTGMYMGVYLAQNFEVPRINDPRIVWEKLLGFLEKNRRDPKKVSISNVLSSHTMKELVVDESPSKTEAIFVPEASKSASFVQTGSQTEMELLGENIYIQHDQITANSNLEIEPGEVPEDINPTEEMEHLPSDPISDKATTLILTGPEERAADRLRMSSSEILLASLTLDKNRPISRSFTKLN